MNRNGEDLLGMILADHMLVEQLEDLHRLGNFKGFGAFLLVFVEFLFQDAAANVDATVANVDAGAGNEFFDFGVALATEGTHRQIGSTGHGIERKWIELPESTGTRILTDLRADFH